mgnify:CR=1 FL=1
MPERRKPLLEGYYEKELTIEELEELNAEEDNDNDNSPKRKTHADPFDFEKDERGGKGFELKGFDRNADSTTVEPSKNEKAPLPGATLTTEEKDALDLKHFAKRAAKITDEEIKKVDSEDE